MSLHSNTLNKADIQFAVKAYLKEVGSTATKHHDEGIWMGLAEGIMEDFLGFVEEL